MKVRLTEDPASFLDQARALLLEEELSQEERMVRDAARSYAQGKLMPRVKHGRYVLIPTSDETRGHGTHSLPAVWKQYLGEFLQGIPYD